MQPSPTKTFDFYPRTLYNVDNTAKSYDEDGPAKGLSESRCLVRTDRSHLQRLSLPSRSAEQQMHQ